MTTDMTAKGLVHSIPGAADIAVERHRYSTDHGTLDLDLYRPRTDAPAPAVMFVTGYADPGAAAFFGRPLKDWASYRDWGRLGAASGLAGITYLNRHPADVHALLRHLRAHAAELCLDPDRIGIWSCSGNVPNALGVLARERVRAAALLYGLTLDLDGATEVAQGAAVFHYAVPPVTLDELPRDTPLLVVRAGGDQTPGLLASLDRFIAAARARRLPLTVIEHAEGPHAFDIFDDSPRTHAVIDEVLAFLRRTLAHTDH